MARWRQVSFSFEFFKFFAAPFSNNNFATSYLWNDIATNKSVRLWNFPNLEVLLITYFLALELNQTDAHWYNSEKLARMIRVPMKIAWFRGIILKGSSDPNHFIFEINAAKGRIRHRTTLNLNDIIFNRFGSRFNFRLVLCRIRLFPTLDSRIRWLGSALPLKLYQRGFSYS